MRHSEESLGFISSSFILIFGRLRTWTNQPVELWNHIVLVAGTSLRLEFSVKLNKLHGKQKDFPDMSLGEVEEFLEEKIALLSCLNSFPEKKVKLYSISSQSSCPFSHERKNQQGNLHFFLCARPIQLWSYNIIEENYFSRRAQEKRASMSRDKKCRNLLNEIVFTAAAWESETFPDFLTPPSTTYCSTARELLFSQLWTRCQVAFIHCWLHPLCMWQKKSPEQWKSFN